MAMYRVSESWGTLLHAEVIVDWQVSIDDTMQIMRTGWVDHEGLVPRKGDEYIQSSNPGARASIGNRIFRFGRFETQSW
jgi:hypothetical protein